MQTVIATTWHVWLWQLPQVAFILPDGSIQNPHPPTNQNKAHYEPPSATQVGPARILWAVRRVDCGFSLASTWRNRVLLCVHLPSETCNVCSFLGQAAGGALEDGVEPSSRDPYGDLVPRKHLMVVLMKKKAKEKLGLRLGGGIDSGDYTRQHVYIRGTYVPSSTRAGRIT